MKYAKNYIHAVTASERAYLKLGLIMLQISVYVIWFLRTIVQREKYY